MNYLITSNPEKPTPVLDAHMFSQMTRYGISMGELAGFKSWVLEHWERKVSQYHNHGRKRSVEDFGEWLCSQYAEVLEEQDRVFCNVCGVSYNKEDPCLYH